jgi:DNA repair protein RecO (recombination protein O)
LSNRKHKENAAILQFYTEEYGRASYILYGVQSKRSGKRQAFLQPFSTVVVEAEAHPRRELQQIKEIKADYPHTNLLFDPYKNAMALFLSEVLLRVLRTNEKDKPLFAFLHHSIRYLDLAEKGVANFHITFLIGLTRFLGFFPALEKSNIDRHYYDLKQAFFTPTKPLHNHFLSPQEAVLLPQLTRISYANMHQFRFNRQERTELLERIISYYKLHLQEFGEIQAMSVLKEVFD